MVFELLGPIFSLSQDLLGKNQPNVFLFPPEVFQHFCRDARGFLNVTNARTQMFLPVLKPFKMGGGLGVWCRGPARPLYFHPLCQNSPSLWVGLQLRGCLIPFSTSWFQLSDRKHEQTASELPCTAACADGFICVTFEIVKWRWWKPHFAVKTRQKYLRDSAETHTHKRNILNSLLQLVRCRVMPLCGAGITCLWRNPALEREL